VIVTGWLAYVTAGLREETATLVTFAEQQAKDTKSTIKIAETSAKAAEKAADAAERGVVAADRAWIEVSIEITGPLKLGPEEFEIKAKAGVKNVGKSPATNVSFWLKFCTDAGEASRWIGDRVRDLRYIPVGGLGYGQVLFPNGHASYEQTHKIKRSDFIARIKEIDESGAGDTERVPFTRNFPALVCFAQYGLPSAGNLGKFRYSSDIFEIACIVPDHPGWDGTEQEEFPVDTMELVKTVFGGQTS